MAFSIVRALFLLAFATILVGGNTHAKIVGDVNSSVLIGTFNSQKSTQLFFEALPPYLHEKVDYDQLWLNVHESRLGFVEHHLEIAGLSVSVSDELCEYVQSKDTQCLVVHKQKWNPAATGKVMADAASIGTAMAGKASGFKSLKIPEILDPLEARKGAVADQDIADLDLILPIEEPSGSFKHRESIQSYGDSFDLDPQLVDTPQARAAKAAYDVARNRFIETLQQVGEGINAGEGDAVARERLLALGKQAFESAGSAYLSGFLDEELGQAEALASDAGSGETFVHHVKKNLGESAKTTVESIVSDLVSGMAGQEGSYDFEAKTDEFMLAGARSLIDAGLAAARRSDLYALRNMELEYNINDFENSYLSALVTQPVYQSDDLRHNIFLQGGGILNEKSVDIDDDESRHTLNLGAAYRYLSEDEKYLVGGNVFFDHQWPYNHSRMSVGADAKAENLNVAANYYIPLSDYRESRTDSSGNQYEERALAGYDLELGYTLPFLPELSVFGKGYQYFRDTDDDIRGLELSGEYNIRDDLTIRGALVEENGGRDGVELALQYRIPLYDTDKPNLAREMMKTDPSTVSMRDKIFEKVRRENRIRVEERLKVDDSAVLVSAQFRATSTGLPFDVGGTATAAAVNLPFDTAITIPNGDFAVIDFSNGAVANVSASGGGDVILEYNATTLSVTATNGGFVQFISGSGGGITTVNVPGGTVNLLGTDIDVTDDGTTTTVQVRAGQIEVVPDVGAAVLMGNQSDVVSLTIASGATSLLVNPALETRQEAAFTNLDLINPDPPVDANAAPFINVLPQLITGPQFVGNNADIRLIFTQAVSVAGAPFINGLVGVNARTFAYDAGASSSTQLVFRHVFVAGDVGAASITVQDFDLNGGSIVGIGNGLNAVTAYTDVVLPINDATAPSLVSSTPADNEPAFGRAGNIVLNFNENIQAGVGNIVITDTTDGTDNRIIAIGDAQVSIAGLTLTFNPSSDLELGTDYDITIVSGVIEDSAGNDFAGITTGDLNFTTSSDVTAPIFTGANIADNAVQIARNSNIVLNFDENVVLSGTITLTDSDDASSSVSFTSASPEVSVVGSSITINPSTDLEYAENYEVTWPLGAIEDTSANDAAALNSGDLNFQSVNLEAALTITGTTGAAADGNIDEGNVQGAGYSYNRSGDGVWAADITIPVAPNGVIFECGATGSGNWIGFNNADGVLRARGGVGTALPQNTAASAEEPIASFPAGNYTLTWEHDVSLGRIRVWLDETLVASDSSVSGNFNSGSWAGTDNCGYGTTSSGVPVGEITTSYNGTLNSGLRYYSGQTLP